MKKIQIGIVALKDKCKPPQVQPLFMVNKDNINNFKQNVFNFYICELINYISNNKNAS